MINYNTKKRHGESSINQYIKKRKKCFECSASQNLNKTYISLKKNNLNLSKTIIAKRNDNTKILIKKINDINKTIKGEKIKMKKENKIKNNFKQLEYYFKYQNAYNENIDKKIKKDIFEYQKNIGDFIFLNGKYFYTGHLSYFREGKKFI